MKPRLPRHRDQRGVVILWMAFLILTLLGCVALGVDVAKLMATRSQLQNAADAAALAGASALDPATYTIQPGLAKQRAFYTAGQNKAYEMVTTPVQLDTANDVFVDNVAHTVRVIVRREAGAPIISHFAQVVGWTSMQARAEATARVDSAGSVCRNLVPLAVEPEDEDDDFVAGCAYTYRIKEGGGSGFQGKYGAVEFPLCPDGPCAGMSPTGANTLRCLLENGYGCCVQELACLPAKSGNNSGPVKQAIEARFARDTDQRPDICYEQYTGNGARVLYVPITSEIEDGCYTVQRFGAFFVKRIPGNGNQNFITAEFINATAPGGGGGPGGGSVFALRLIK
ncbi:MAG: hypothetical protein HZC42_09860 [Candidatus Eisenbacteria bacterium]|nr:hypothetical protein [Candidatus Eisenbacteria bacterium]